MWRPIYGFLRGKTSEIMPLEVDTYQVFELQTNPKTMPWIFLNNGQGNGTIASVPIIHNMIQSG